MSKEKFISLDELTKGVGTDGDPQQKIVQIFVDGKPIAHALPHVNNDGVEIVPTLQVGTDGKFVKNSDGQPILKEVPLGTYVQEEINRARSKK